MVMEGKKFDGPQYWMEKVQCAVQDLVNRERISTNGGQNVSDESGCNNGGQIR